MNVSDNANEGAMSKGVLEENCKANGRRRPQEPRGYCENQIIRHFSSRVKERGINKVDGLSAKEIDLYPYNRLNTANDIYEQVIRYIKMENLSTPMRFQR